MNLSYETHYYCPRCQAPIPKEKAVNGYRCPRCNSILRTKPRKARIRRPLPRIDPEAYGVVIA